MNAARYASYDVMRREIVEILRAQRFMVRPAASPSATWTGPSPMEIGALMSRVQARPRATRSATIAASSAIGRASVASEGKEKPEQEPKDEEEEPTKAKAKAKAKERARRRAARTRASGRSRATDAVVRDTRRASATARNTKTATC